MVDEATADSRWFGASLVAAAAESGSRTALVFDGRSWSYSAFDRLVGRAVGHLRELGVRKGDRVVMHGVPRPEAFVALFAVTRMGAVLVPLHPDVTGSELEAISAETTPRAVIADDLPDGGAPRIGWAELCAEDQPAAGDLSEPPAGSDIAIVPFTSGTSGRPKGVALTHDNLRWSMANGLASLPLTERDVALVATPLAHVAVLGGLPQYVWARRGTVVLASRFEPDLFIDLVRDHQVTTAFAVPAMLALLAQHPRFDSAALDSLGWVLAGGSPAVPATTTRFRDRGIQVINSYGLTEACAGVTYAAGEVAGRPTSAGRPAPYVDLRVLDHASQPVPVGTTGEIWLHGPSIAPAYWTRTGLTPVANPDGWFQTGDRGRYDEHGCLEIVGRVKDTIITGGENVDPAEVENALADLPGALEVGVCGTPDALWGEVVTAFVVGDVSLEDLRRHLDGRLSKHKWPRRVHLVGALPRGVTGKLERRRLAELVPQS